MKKKWILPQANVESFTTNEYLSTCWGVACDYDQANKYEANIKSGETHNKDNCGKASNQYLQDTDNDNYFDKMTEVGTDGLGDLPCKLFTDETYSTRKPFGSVNANDYIYWTTEVGTGTTKRTWHHQGKVQLQSTSHPNRS